MNPAAIGQTLAWCALATACLSPFLFGAVERSIWMPLCVVWAFFGLASSLLARHADVQIGRILLPLHALFLIQLLPLPAWAIRILSPGSYAAHYLPDPGDGLFRTLSVSPSATIEAWLYVAGLQGLFLVVFSLDKNHRRAGLKVILAAMLILAGEALWQSRTEHPYWLYGRIPIVVPSGFETAQYGPYFNRNHFATTAAVACGISAGLASATAASAGGLLTLLRTGRDMAQTVGLFGLSFFFVVTSAASGSRSGTLAALAAVAVLTLRTFGRRLFVAFLAVAVPMVALTGAASVERLSQLDLMASRFHPWLDMTRLLRFFPVVGSGLGTFAVAYWPYQRHVTYEFWQHAHNEYLQLAIEGGLVGALAAFVVLLNARKALEFHPALKEAGIGVAVAIGVHSAFDFPGRIPANAALVTSALALCLRSRGPR